MMWIAVYLLIGLSGSRALNEYAFYVAFLGVFLAGYAANRLCRGAIERRSRRQMTATLEMIHTDDIGQLRRIYRNRLIMSAASFIYMVIATAGLLLGEASLVIVAIFAIFTYLNGKEVHKTNSVYQKLKEAQHIEVPDEGPMREALANYAYQRERASFKELTPVPTADEKALRVFNIVMSVLCLIIGALFVYFFGHIVLEYGTSQTGAVINAAYGLLALLYGAIDLYSLTKGYNFNYLP